MGIVRRNVQLKSISAGLRLPKGYRKRLLEGFVEARRRSQRDREKESKLRSARLAGKTTQQVFKRDEHVMVAGARVVPGGRGNPVRDVRSLELRRLRLKAGKSLGEVARHSQVFSSALE